MKISEAIKEIIKLKGLTIFNDYKRFKEFLADFSTDTHKRELDVFKNAVDENMLKMCIDDSLEEYRKILKLQIQLENKGLTQDWINFIIESFALPLGWNYTPKPTTQLQPQTQQVQKQNTSSSQNEWTCVCGTVNTTKYCTTCGKQKGQQVQNQKPSIQQQQQAKQQITKQTHPQQKHQSQQPLQNRFWNLFSIFKQQKQQAQQSVQKQGNPFKSAKVGDYIKFGSYPQTSNGDIQPIEWQVLSIENNKMLVISRYGLDAKRFDSSSNVWKKSEIRKWLNGDFYNKAFSEDDKKYINLSNLSDVGTSDNVFLLSKEEVEKYFANNDSRRCKATDYAVKNGAWVNSRNDSGKGYSVWWLRSPSLNLVYDVSSSGLIIYCISVYFDNDLARPALWINL